MRVLAVLATGCVLAPAAAAATRQPHLRLDRTRPLVVAGSSFRTGERVRLVVHAARVIVFHTRSRDGSFTARLGVVPMPRCTSVRIVAVGSQGSRAQMILPRPSCSPPTQP